MSDLPALEPTSYRFRVGDVTVNLKIGVAGAWEAYIAGHDRFLRMSAETVEDLYARAEEAARALDVVIKDIADAERRFDALYERVTVQPVQPTATN